MKMQEGQWTIRQITEGPECQVQVVRLDCIESRESLKVIDQGSSMTTPVYG